MLEVCKWGLNVYEINWLPVRGSGLFQVPGFASGSGWRIEMDVVHRMNKAIKRG